MPGKTVFIFGAGASKAELLPMQSKLLEKYFAKNPNDEYSGDLREYFRNFFGIDNTSIDSIKWPTLEEALAMVEIAIDKEQFFGPIYPMEKLKKIREGLIFSMGSAIEEAFKKSKGIYYNKFINKLFRGKHFSKGQYTFVSFNYDIILDIALMNLMTSKQIDCDYGINFANSSKDFVSSAFPQWKPPGEKSVLILKPHGSINWMHCPTCGSIAISGDKESKIFKAEFIHSIEVCPKDNTQMQFVIEPPSYFKKYKNYYIQTIWKKLDEILLDSEKMVFIGYCMPDADVMIKYALKKACIGKNKRIVVINPDKDIAERYERILGTVEFNWITFEQLCESINYNKIINEY